MGGGNVSRPAGYGFPNGRFAVGEGVSGRERGGAGDGNGVRECLAMTGPG